MSIKDSIQELEKIHDEIRAHRLHIKGLSARSKELETNIQQYLESKQQEGLKYNGKAIIIEKKETQRAKPKKQAKVEVVTYLQKMGIDDPELAYTKLASLGKQSPVKTSKIKMKKIPQEG